MSNGLRAPAVRYPGKKGKETGRRGGAGRGDVEREGARGGQAIISNSVRSNGSHVRLIIIESSKRGCLIEASRALRGFDAD